MPSSSSGTGGEKLTAPFPRGKRRLRPGAGHALAGAGRSEPDGRHHVESRRQACHEGAHERIAGAGGVNGLHPVGGEPRHGAVFGHEGDAVAAEGDQQPCTGLFRIDDKGPVIGSRTVRQDRELDLVGDQPVGHL